MEFKEEDAEMVEIFFKLFNEALANFLGEEDYKFNPMILCMEEAVMNLHHVRNVFGDHIISQVASCQRHCAEAIAIYPCE